MMHIDLSVFPPAHAKKARKIIKLIRGGSDPCCHPKVDRIKRFPDKVAVARLGPRWRLLFAKRGNVWVPVWAGTHEDYNKLDHRRWI